MKPIDWDLVLIFALACLGSVALGLKILMWCIE